MGRVLSNFRNSLEAGKGCERLIASNISGVSRKGDSMRPPWAAVESKALEIKGAKRFRRKAASLISWRVKPELTRALAAGMVRLLIHSTGLSSAASPISGKFNSHSRQYKPCRLSGTLAMLRRAPLRCGYFFKSRRLPGLSW